MDRLLVMVLVLAFTVSGHAQEGKEARALFDKMEQKLLGAKTVSVKLRTEVLGERLGRGNLEGTLVLEQPKKVKVVLKGFLDNQGRNMELTSDGKATKWFVTGFGDGGGPATALMNPNILVWLSRGDVFSGLYMGMGLEWAEAGIDAKKELKAFGFKMGEKGKVGKVDAQAIEYKVHSREADANYSVTLWIDATLYVPLKRRIAVSGNRGDITETYSEYKIDSPVPASIFTLPK